MLMPGRTYSATSGYRYGFNGKENDNEVKGEGNEQDYGMRIYDPRLGKFLSVDPLKNEYSFLTPYQYASNTPIQAKDRDGEEQEHYTLSFDNQGKPVLTHTHTEHTKFEHFRIAWTNTLIPFPYVQRYFTEDKRYIVHTGTYYDDAFPRMAGVTYEHMEVKFSYETKKDLQQALQGLSQEKVNQRVDTYKKIGLVIKGFDATAEEMKQGFVPGTKQIKLKLSAKINVGQQEKHIEGKNNYNNLVRQGNKPSILTRDAQALLDDVHAGNVKSIQPAGDKLRVDFGKPIGFIVDEKTGMRNETSVGLISDGKKGAHIVPGKPSK
jgi:RHS repeat-associated protein